MPAGTIALTINSKTVTGTGTAFTTELKVSDFLVAVVGGVTYTLGVASIASNTSLTLNTAFGGPTTSGLAWTAVPNQAMVGITAQIAADTARAIHGLNYDKDNWQKIYSASGTITVTLPDGATYSGPSWNSITTTLNNKVDLTTNQTITGNKLFTGNIGIGSPNFSNPYPSIDFHSSGSNVDYDVRLVASGGSATSPGQGLLNIHAAYLRMNGADLIKVGDFGLGAASGVTDQATDQAMLKWMRTTGSGFYRNNSYTSYNSAYSAGILSKCGDTFMYINASYTGTEVRIATGTENSVTASHVLWTNKNTTVDTNNFIKKASPIARLTNDVSGMQTDFVVEGQHMLNGLAAVNEEAEGVNAEKVSIGVYRVTGSIGLSVEGWTIEGPQDNNGNRLCFIESEMDGEALIIRVSSRRFDINTAMIVANEPMDIPSGRWIDLRLQMPDDSAWNTRMRELKQQPADQEPEI